MKQDMQARIQRMFMQDCLMAWTDVLLLWCAVGFVLYSVLGVLQDPSIRLALYIGCGLLVLFNTASISAMTHHYAEDKDFIYGLDIKHLDANKMTSSQH
jgi:hypothetical protein